MTKTTCGVTGTAAAGGREQRGTKAGTQFLIPTELQGFCPGNLRCPLPQTAQPGNPPQAQHSYAAPGDAPVSKSCILQRNKFTPREK